MTLPDLATDARSASQRAFPWLEERGMAMDVDASAFNEARIGWIDREISAMHARLAALDGATSCAAPVDGAAS